ncbi:MAG: hypothetical protein ACE5MI_01980 [Acidimicrobiia bacterium]
MIPARRHWALEDLEEDRLHVFVPGAMGTGLLLSLGLLLSDVYRRAGGQQLAERRVELTARAAGTDVVGGPGTSLAEPGGMRRSWIYVVVTFAALGLVAWLIPGATWNYFNPGGYIEGKAWIWAISVLAIMFFAFVGITVALAAPRWLPWVVGTVGILVTTRFTLTASTDLKALVAIGLLLSFSGMVYAAHRYVRRVDHLPARAWPLFVSTPLTRQS